MIDYLIKTPRLGLRTWQTDDLDAFAVINADPEVMRYFPSALSREETAAFIERLQKHQAENDYCYFAADVLETGELIGFIGIARQTYLKNPPTFTDIGWRLKQSAWGKGLATEGANAVLNFAFRNTDVAEIYSVCSVVNFPSERVMQKIGMQHQRIFRHPKLTNSPRLEKCHLYCIKKEDFTARQ